MSDTLTSSRKISWKSPPLELDQGAEYRWPRMRCLWLGFPLFAIWTNTHGSFAAINDFEYCNYWLQIGSGDGFVEIGRRRDYYPAPAGREDAIVMARDV